MTSSEALIQQFLNINIFQLYFQVEALRSEDANNEIEIAKILDGFIKRKVIKQTVMTTVYGVTKYGAKIQISKQLKGFYFFLSCLLFYFYLFIIVL